jgi:hypothetical protein
MRAPARRSTAYDAFDDDERYLHGELTAGERSGAPLARTGGKAILRGVVILSALGGGWVLLGDQAPWSGWLPFDTAAVSSWLDRRVPGQVEPAASAMAANVTRANTERTTKPAAFDAPPTSLQPPASSKADVAPDAPARSATAPLTTAALPPAAASHDDPQAAPLRPAIADPADPYQVRAEAVGLHPELSRVLLARLSATDYRNAGVAIQTAMAETADSAVFTWPRQRKPELALFQVRFVPGAAPGCRRYVVTVTKDGWVTTALPMEKCGSEARRGAAR